MPAIMPSGPMGDGGSSKQQLAAGPPRAPMKKVPDYQQNTLAMLGSNPLDSANGGAVSPGEGGTAGVALASVAMMLKGAQNLASIFPAVVPQEVLLWLDNLMQTVPQLIQQGNQFGGGAAAGAAGAGGAMPMLGSMQPAGQPQQPAPPMQ